MFSRPNSADSQYAVADFLEWQCLTTKTEVSAMSYRSLLSISDDETCNEGIESSDDISLETLDCAIAECYNRSQICPHRYPFTTGRSSLELKVGQLLDREIYTFLLLATRLDMNEQRMQGGYDGTQLFEELCAEVAKEYYGGHAKTQIFGTSVRGTFKDKVEHLLKALHVNGSFKQPVGSTGRQKDGNLDIVAWIPFSDQKDGQMIAFGQCKTGTSWEEKLHELDPEDFFTCYSTQHPFVKPLRMFFVAESFGFEKWEERSVAGGIIFDRTRIMEFLPQHLDEGLLEKIIKWNKSAIGTEINN